MSRPRKTVRFAGLPQSFSSLRTRPTPQYYMSGALNPPATNTEPKKWDDRDDNTRHKSSTQWSHDDYPDLCTDTSSDDDEMPVGYTAKRASSHVSTDSYQRFVPSLPGIFTGDHNFSPWQSIQSLLGAGAGSTRRKGGHRDSHRGSRRDRGPESDEDPTFEPRPPKLLLSHTSITLFGCATFVLYTTVYILDAAKVVVEGFTSPPLKELPKTEGYTTDKDPWREFPTVLELMAKLSFWVHLAAFWSAVATILLVRVYLPKARRQRKSNNPRLAPATPEAQQAMEFTANILYYIVSGIICLVLYGFSEWLINELFNNSISIVIPVAWSLIIWLWGLPILMSPFLWLLNDPFTPFSIPKQVVVQLMVSASRLNAMRVEEHGILIGDAVFQIILLIGMVNLVNWIMSDKEKAAPKRPSFLRIAYGMVRDWPRALLSFGGYLLKNTTLAMVIAIFGMIALFNPDFRQAISQLLENLVAAISKPQAQSSASAEFLRQFAYAIEELEQGFHRMDPSRGIGA